MPTLACRTCGRRVYTPHPLEALFAEERRCPRCGASLETERRAVDRRQVMRRQNPPDDPGPPSTEERRVAERRGTKPRRRNPSA